MRYHINAKGNPYPCKAAVKCPFGDLEKDHYDSKGAALKAYEESQKDNTLPEGRKKQWSDYSLEELREIEVSTILEKIKSGEEYTDDEYNRHREYIRKVDAAYPSTHKQYTVKVKGKTVYTPERRAQQVELLNELEEKYQHVPNEGVAIFSGGMPGAGKTTFLKKTQKDLDRYASINPDDVKEAMVRKGMAPKIEGLTPLETNSIIHYEAALLTNELYERAAQQKKNLVIDKTMGSENTVTKEVEDLKAKGYSKVSAVFVDVDPDVAYERIVARHRAGLNAFVKSEGKTLGERAVKGTIISGSRTDKEGFYSKNSEVFQKVKERGLFSETHYFDNNGSLS